MDPQATAGRIVHYTDATGRAVAAIVCVDAAPDGMVALMTFYPDQIPVSMRAVPYSEEPAPGCWSWMPYQKAKAERPGGNQSESAEPRPSEETLRSYRAALADLNDRISDLEFAAVKEADAAKAADPAEDLAPDIGSPPALAETTVRAEPRPAAPDAAQDGQEAPEAAPDDAAR